MSNQTASAVAALANAIDWEKLGPEGRQSIIEAGNKGLMGKPLTDWLVAKGWEKDGDWKNPAKASPSPVNPSLIAIDWQSVYQTLGLEAELVKSGIQIITSNFWEVPVIKGVTMNMVVQALRKLKVKVDLYTNDLDANVTKNDRDPAQDGSYLVKFRRNVEADEEFANKSANDLAKGEKEIKGITLLERLLLELGYFMATKEHLDVNDVTLCSGSRDSDGDVPSVYWYADYRKLFVLWGSPDHSHSSLRARAVVS